jgi:hypothetical protein
MLELRFGDESIDGLAFRDAALREVAAARPVISGTWHVPRLVEVSGSLAPDACQL